MSPAWLTTAFAGALLIVLGVVLITFTRRAQKRIDRELAQVRKELLVQLSANDREHARALLKCAQELFVAGHVTTAAMLEMHATDFELRADDQAQAANQATEPPVPEHTRS